MALTLQLSDGTDTINLADFSTFCLQEGGVELPAPQAKAVWAGSALRDGETLSNLTYSNRQIVLHLTARGDSVIELEQAIAQVQQMLRTAQEDALVGRERVTLAYRKRYGVTTLTFDVLDGEVLLPPDVHSGALISNEIPDLAIRLTCKPYGRGQEVYVAKATGAIRRTYTLDTDGYSDDDQGMFAESSVTNECTNPSIETNTTSWSARNAATLSRVSTYAKVGTYSLRIQTPGAVGDEGAEYQSFNAGAAATVWATFYARGTATIKATLWSVADGMEIPAAGDPVNLGLYSGWHRCVFGFVTVSAGAYYLRIVSSGVQTEDFNVDAVQIEEATFWTSYCDGSLGRGYAWTGAAHGSTSTRAETNVTQTGGDAFDKDAGHMAMWVKPTWPFDVSRSVVPTLFLAYADANNFLELYYNPGTDQFIARKVAAGGSYPATSAVQSFAAEALIHVAFTWSLTSGVKLYLNGTLSNSNGNTTPLATAPTTLRWAHSVAANAQVNGLVWVQSYGTEAIDADQVAALYAAGQQRNALAYLEPNQGTVLDGTTIDANKGTQTFTNYNCRTWLRDVQGHGPATFRSRIYNPTATTYGTAWMALGRAVGNPAIHVIDLAASGVGVNTVAVAALGDQYIALAAMSTAALEKIATGTVVADHYQRRYRVLARISGPVAGTYFTVSLYAFDAFTFHTARICSTTASAAFRDLGVMTFAPNDVVDDRDPTLSWGIYVYAGKATAADPINIDYLVLIPVDYEMFWDDPQAAPRWRTGADAYLAVETRRDALSVLTMAATEVMTLAIPGGAYGDILKLPTGDSLLTVLGATEGAAWDWDNTWQVDYIKYAPIYLVPPGV